MAENMDIKNVDLRKVPREIVVLALNLYGNERYNTSCTQKNLRYFKDEFLELFDLGLAIKVAEKQKELVAEFKTEANKFIDHVDFSRTNGGERFRSIYNQTEHWINYYQDKLNRQKMAYDLIYDFMNNEIGNFNAGRPVEVGLVTEKTPYAHVVTKGNVMKYSLYNGRAYIDEVYTDADYSNVIDEFIAKLYPQNEQSIEQNQ